MIKLLRSTAQIVVTDEDLVEGGDPGTRYTLRPLSDDVQDSLRKTHTTKVPNRRTHVMTPELDTEGFALAMYDYALQSWEGVTIDGAPAPCTLEYKRMLDTERKIAICRRAGQSEVAPDEVGQELTFRRPA